jgi:hypothetical protein
MIHEAPPASHLVAATEATTPSPEPPPPAESTLPPPTIEQTQAADHVFIAPPPRDPLASLAGVWASALVLRDLAIENFDTSGADEEPEEEPTKGEDAD